MKLYLSSVDVPTPNDLAELLGKPLKGASVAIIPNAQDYYSERARNYKNNECAEIFKSLGFNVETIDLRDYSEAAGLKTKLQTFDLIWARGGNTFCLRYEMRRSGFDAIIKELLEAGIVYGGDSAGALVAGISIQGIESADIPEFAKEVVNEGLSLVPFVVLPHADNSWFLKATETVKSINNGKNKLIELKDTQAVLFNNNIQRIVDAPQN